jgi:CTP:molybdopterin cytidylyltransferase MocA
MRKEINSVVLAAGLSGRMGKFKPLLEYRGKSFIQNIVIKLNSVCDKTIIVTGFKSNEVEENVIQLRLKGKIEYVFNRKYEKGMFTSLQAGLRAAKNPDWVLYHFVDQPGLPEKFYTDFIEQIDDKYSWIQPSFKKQNGHPILIHKSLFDLILKASPDSSLREISKNPVVNKKFWDCEYEEIFQDIDTDEDYRNL